jgi:hypothetical protein
MARWTDRLRALLHRDEPGIDPDGFGQSLADDLRFLHRFRRCRRRAVTWRTPTADERAAIDGDPVIGRFGDDTVALAQVDGRRWIVRDRVWHGWPDPPQFAFFAVEPDGAIWAGADFDRWPAVWRRP